MIFNTGKLELYYEKTGEGCPLVMLHGNGEDGTIFGPLARKLSRHFTVYLIDSRNHGRSGRMDDVSYDAMAEDLVDFVNGLGLCRPHIVGFSDGAITAIMASLTGRVRFGKMALLGPNLSPKDFRPEFLTEMENIYANTGDPLVNLMLTEPDIDPMSLHSLTEPVLVIGAENDMYPLLTFTTITDGLPNARLRIMYGHDHGSYIVGSDLLYGPLKDFFCVG